MHVHCRRCSSRRLIQPQPSAIDDTVQCTANTVSVTSQPVFISWQSLRMQSIYCQQCSMKTLINTSTPKSCVHFPFRQNVVSGTPPGMKPSRAISGLEIDFRGPSGGSILSVRFRLIRLSCANQLAATTGFCQAKRCLETCGLTSGQGCSALSGSALARTAGSMRCSSS